MTTGEAKTPIGPRPLQLGPLAIDPPIVQAPMAGFSNFAFRRIVRELGGESIAMGFAPGGLGRYIEEELEKAGIDTDFVHTEGETRTNIAILDEARHGTTILSAPGPNTDPAAVEELRARQGIGSVISPGDQHLAGAQERG